MKVLFVGNDLFGKGNGLNSSARRTVHYLRRSGIDVRLLCMANRNPGDDNPQPEFMLQKMHFPIFQNLIEAESFCFAKRDEKVMREAIEWADVIHLEEPFILESHVANLAKEMCVPCVGTFHIHPENITSAIRMGGWRGVNFFLMRSFQRLVFDKCTDIQCPTQNVLDRLKRYGFKARLHLIPNGAILDNVSEIKAPQTNPYVILCVGRLAVEKDQPTLLKAMRYSKYADKIQLHFAGKGPEEKRIRKMADKLVSDGVLKYEPEFGFHTLNQLRSIAQKSYLYIHCAPIEVEGLSCIEVIREGLVPVIAQGRLTATSQFALDERSLFPAGNAKALAERIDWWIEHPEERIAMGPKYSESVEKYAIQKSIDALIEMYKTSIENYKK